MPDKKFFTTGEAARILKISRQTVNNYCDSGKIMSEKAPLTNYRRIPVKQLMQFMEKNNLSTEFIETNGRMRVMIVDDDPQVVKLLSRIIRQCDDSIVIETAAEGYEACAKAGALSPQLIFMDLKLPGMDGIEVCRTIRNLKQTKHSQIIVLTGYATMENTEKLEQFNIHEVIKKPFVTNELKKTINGILNAVQIYKQGISR